MASKVPPNIPYSIAVPSGSPNSILGIAGFLTTLMVGLNSWINRAATAINANLAAAAGSITEIVAGAGLTGGGSDRLGCCSFREPGGNGSGGTGSASGISLTGDVAGGPSAPSIATTLATVNSDVGTFQGLTVNGKGLVTAAANQSYLTGNQTITLSGDATGSGATTIAVTLATVNTDVGTFQGLTVNGKGLVTAAVTTAKAATQGSAQNPTGTSTGTPGVMMGLAGTITPKYGTAIHVTINGNAFVATALDAGVFQIAYGTGTAPGNGVAATGTAVGSKILFTPTTTTERMPFSTTAVITGLSAGTAYWLDLILIATVAGNAVTVQNTAIAAFEI